MGPLRKTYDLIMVALKGYITFTSKSATYGADSLHVLNSYCPTTNASEIRL